jgi:hypothetical protein
LHIAHILPENIMPAETPLVVSAKLLILFWEELERAMRFELTTSTLARLRSTPELRPRAEWLAPHPEGLAENQRAPICRKGKAFATENSRLG